MSCPMKMRDCLFSKDFDYDAVAATRTIRYVTTNRGIWAGSTAVGFSASTEQVHRNRIGGVGLVASTWGCVYRSIIQPNEQLVADIAGDLDPLLAARVPICIHHRSGDENMKNQGTGGEPGRDITQRIKCVADAIRLLNSSDSTEPGASTHAAGLPLWGGTLKPRDTYVFLAADSSAIKADATAMLGMDGVDIHVSRVRPVHVNNFDIERVGGAVVGSPEARMYDALRDWFVLATCPVWAGSLESAFSRAAAVYAMSTHVMAGNFGALPGDGNAGPYCKGFVPVANYLHVGAGARA